MRSTVAYKRQHRAFYHKHVNNTHTNQRHCLTHVWTVDLHGKQSQNR